MKLVGFERAAARSACARTCANGRPGERLSPTRDGHHAHSGRIAQNCARDPMRVRFPRGKHPSSPNRIAPADAAA